MIRRWLNEGTASLRIAQRFAFVLRPHGWSFALIALLMLAGIALELAKPWPIQWILDEGLIGTPRSGWTREGIVLWGALLALGLVLLDALFDYGAAIWTAKVSQSVARSLRLAVFDHLAHLAPAFYARMKSGDLIVRLMGDVSLVRTMLVEASAGILTRTLLIVMTATMMMLLDWQLTLIVLGIVPIALLATLLIARSLQIATRKQRVKEGELADSMHEAIHATQLIQSLGRSGDIVHRFARDNRRTARAELKSTRLSARLAVSIELVFGVSTAAALLFGSQRVLAGSLSAGELMVFLSYVRSLLKPMRATSKHTGRFAKGIASAERLLEVLDEPIAVTSRPGAPAAPSAPRQLRFEGVRYAYGPRIEALRGFDAEYRAGELVGLFGASGSGKSTVAALAVRLFDPDAGRVLLDGVPLCDWDLESLRERFGVALQDSVLFGATLRDNLLLGKLDASDEQLLTALEEAGARAFVERLPHGLDTELGSQGTGLSGGERRRLCLARTLLRRAPILIVDEPFAGLDKPAVDRLCHTLAERARDAIVIVVAHDLDHLERFDRIDFLSQGVLHDSGTHGELVARNALYRQVTRSVKAEGA